MKFNKLSGNAQVNIDNDRLLSQYRAGRAFGPVTVSDDVLFVRKGLKTYYIAYSDAEKVFRRVRVVNASICCGKGELQIEYLAVCADQKELIEVQLPGNKAARMLMEELKKRAPKLDTEAHSKAVA